MLVLTIPRLRERDPQAAKPLNMAHAGRDFRQ